MERPEEYLTPAQTAQGAASIVIAGRTIVVEQACTYKTLEAAKLVMRLVGTIDFAKMVPELITLAERGADQISQLFLVARLLPAIADAAPDALLDLAALLLVPNAELRLVFRHPNGVKLQLDANRQWLLFDAPPDAALAIVTAFIPHLGLDQLQKKLGPLLQSLSGLLTRKPQEEASPVI